MYRASIENRGDSKYHATMGDYRFVMDTEGEGANPVDTLLASLCACIGHQVRDLLQEQQISSRGFTVHAEARLTRDKVRLDDISVSVDMKNVHLSEMQRTKLVEYAERCKIHNTLKCGCAIDILLK